LDYVTAVILRMLFQGAVVEVLLNFSFILEMMKNSRMTNSPYKKRGKRNALPHRQNRYAALKPNIAVISFVSSLRCNSASTHKWGFPYSSYNRFVANAVI